MASSDPPSVHACSTRLVAGGNARCADAEKEGQGRYVLLIYGGAAESALEMMD